MSSTKEIAVVQNDLIRYAASPDWKTEHAAERFADVDIKAAIQRYHHWLRPMKDVDPQFNNPSASGSQANRLREALIELRRKVRPDWDKGTSKRWITSTMTALSDLSAFTAALAAEEAIHTVVKYPNEIEERIRDLAKLLQDRHRATLKHLAELARWHDGWRPPKVIENRAEYAKGPLTQDEVDTLAQSELGLSIIKMGVDKGEIQAQPDGGFRVVER